MGIRALAEGDEETLRTLRLRALADSPQQFSSTYEREVVRTIEDWRRWFSPGATFVFEPEGTGPAGLAAAGLAPAGLAAAVPDDEEPRVVWLMAMWVEPAARGTGAADALVDAVVGWARRHRATTVRLDVVEGNVPARRVYERHGFRATGLAERNGRVEVAMELDAAERS